MRISYHIGSLVVIGCLGGLILALGLTDAYRKLLASERYVAEEAETLRDLQLLRDNLRHWLTTSELVLEGADHELLTTTRGETPELLSVVDDLVGAPLVGEHPALVALPGLIRTNDLRLATTVQMPDDERVAALPSLLETLRVDSARTQTRIVVMQEAAERAAAVSLRNVQERRDALFVFTWLACVGYLAIVGTLWRWMVVKLIRPIESLTLAAEDAIDGESPLTLDDNGPLEVRQLTRSVRSCVSNLGEKVAERTAELAERQDELKREIAERCAAEERLRHDALHDALTDLPNRTLLMERLGRCRRRALREPDFVYAVLFMDLDNFKVVNDSLGHAVGDELLVEVAQRVATCIRDLDTAARIDQDLTARLGGDEFVILLERLRDTSDAVRVARRVQERLGDPFMLRGHEVVISSSIGIAIGAAGSADPEALLRDADTAMYRAKSSGKAQHALFDEAMHADAISRLRLENDLRRAVEQEQFSLVYQPIVALSTGRIIAFEALLRWNHQDHGPISPAEFIPVAEENGQIVRLGHWVLQRACHDLARWNADTGGNHPMQLNVNVSKRQIAEPGFVELVSATLLESGVPGDHLRLEITESTIMENTESVVDILHRLRRLGVELHMDDFGTGYSSLSCIHRFPIDVLKIDQEFVATMGEDHRYTAVVRAVTMLAHALGIQVTAEGVETARQAAALVALDCDFAQGYLYSRPVDVEGAWDLIRSEQRRSGAA